MKESKLRGMAENGEWIYGTGISDFLNIYPNKKGTWLWSDYWWKEVKPETRSQYTTAKDSNKKEIYAGHKVRLSCGEGYSNDHFHIPGAWSFAGTVAWDKNNYCWCVHDDDWSSIPFSDIFNGDVDIDITIVD